MQLTEMLATDRFCRRRAAPLRGYRRPWRAAVLLALLASLPAAYGEGEHSQALERDVRDLRGWKVHISRALAAAEPQRTALAVELLDAQLAEIERVVPEPAVARLRQVPLYFSPQYPGVAPKAEYHPSGEWLREHGRDPAMARSVEFTNIGIFAQETRRMPNFALHELAHAYHDRFLPDGFDNREIRRAFDRANAQGAYDHVERWNGRDGANTFERAYALSDPQEYFAETTEAYFSRNDFYPFTRADLERHDREMCRLLARLWNPSDVP